MNPESKVMKAHSLAPIPLPRFHLITTRLALFLLVCVSATVSVAADKPMNVVMLIADDLNSWLLENPQRYTGKVIAPNLKRLAESGVNFKYAYTAAPVCSPSRTAFFSGVAPWKSGIYNNAQTINKSEPLKQDAVLSLAGLFKKGGYDTFGYGKITHGWDQNEHWNEHVGHKRDPSPPGAPLAKLSGGAYARFDSNSAGKLADLLGAVASYARGGHAALEKRGGDSAKLLLQQLKS